METQDDVTRLKKLIVRSDVQSHHVRGQPPMYQLTEFTEFRRHTYVYPSNLDSLNLSSPFVKSNADSLLI